MRITPVPTQLKNRIKKINELLCLLNEDKKKKKHKTSTPEALMLIAGSVQFNKPRDLRVSARQLQGSGGALPSLTCANPRPAQTSAGDVPGGMSQCPVTLLGQEIYSWRTSYSTRAPANTALMHVCARWSEPPELDHQAEDGDEAE